MKIEGDQLAVKDGCVEISSKSGHYLSAIIPLDQVLVAFDLSAMVGFDPAAFSSSNL